MSQVPPCNICNNDRAITTEGRLASIETELRGIREDIREIMAVRLENHESRLSSLERRGLWLMGWVAGAGAVGGIVAKYWEKVGL